MSGPSFGASRRLRGGLMAGILIAASPAIAGAQQAPTTAGALFQPMDIFRLAQAAEPQIAPDGATIAYVRMTNDITIDDAKQTIRLLDRRSGNQRQIATTAIDAAQPRWCGDGRRLAFTARPTGEERGIFVHEPASARTRRIATLPSAASAISWSPDCTRIAFVMHAYAPAPTLGTPLNKPAGADWAPPLRVITRATYHKDGKGLTPPGYDHIFVVPSNGGAVRQVTSGDYDDAGALSWSPDGRSLLFTSLREADADRAIYRSAIYRVGVDGGAPERLTSLDGPLHAAAYSPDGRTIAFTGFDDRKRRTYEDRHIYLMPAEGGEARALTGAIDRSFDEPIWAADGRALYALLDDRGVRKVARITLDGTVTTLGEGVADSGLDLPYCGGSFTVSRDGTIAFPQGDPGHPGEVAIAAGGKTTRLTALNDALLKTRVLGALSPLAVKANDGTPIDAWLMTPPHFDPSRKYPLILEIHGGPTLSYGPYFSTDDQLYAAAGYVVVYANARGSATYGAAFANAIDRDYPGVDYDDQMRVVDAAIARGFVDPDRLFVTGGSAGGVMTAWMVGKTDRFRAAVSQRPVMNWTSLALMSDSGSKMMSNWIGTTPWENPEAFWRHSPLSLVGNVKTPTLLIAGENDIRTPFGEAAQYYGALQFRGVPTGLVTVPGAFHELAARPSHAAAKAEAVLAWFARFDRPIGH
ncbi:MULTISPECIES: S9 family peptidase [unclassified Sphingomonas]|uniref:S9 family peptidase n=1 Tax=unclassified Sphingomonas TaxID=196159 RepID=UPI000AC14B60|nr:MULTISPECIES: S9 family peptidase [unclassified Sphingomonas]